MVLKGKFKVDMPINAKVTAVQSLEHLLYIEAVMLVGKRMPFSLTPQATKTATSLSCNSVFI